MRSVLSASRLGRISRPVLVLLLVCGALFVNAPSVQAGSIVLTRADIPSPDLVLRVTTADDIVSDADRQLSLREAFTIAAQERGTVAIVLIRDNTHLLTCGDDEDANVSGDLDFTGQNTLILRGRGATIAPAPGPCESARLIDMPGGGDLILKNISLRGGRSNSDGGAIRGATVSIIESSIEDSETIGGRGGAVFATADLAIVSSEISQSSATASGIGLQGTGGAIHSLGDVWVTDSSFWGNVATYDGGAIHVSRGHGLSISDSTLSSNYSNFGRGGAVFGGDGALVRVSGSVFDANVVASAATGGGALFVAGELDVQDTVFVANEARSVELSAFLSRGGGGGAIYSEGRLSIDNSSFDNNRAGRAGAGGAVNHKGAAVVTRSEVIANSAGGAGGGLYLVGNLELGELITLDAVNIVSNSSNGTGGGGLFASSAGEVRVHRSRIGHNSALNAGSQGGGMFVRGRTIIAGTTIDNNAVSSTGTGGGVHAEQGSVVAIVDSTIADNIAGAGGGVDVDQGPGVVVRIEHSTLAGNSAQSGANLSVRALLTIGSSIIGDEVSGPGCHLAQAATSLGSSIDGDGSCDFGGLNDVVVGVGVPITADLVVEAGQAVRRPLLEAAIGLVPSAVCELHPIDQVGVARVGRCDAGAVETQVTGPTSVSLIDTTTPVATTGPVEAAVGPTTTTAVPVSITPVTTVPVATVPVTTVPVATVPVTTVPVATVPVATVPVTSTSTTVELGRFENPSFDVGSIVIASSGGSIAVLGNEVTTEVWSPASNVVAVAPTNGLNGVWLGLGNGRVVLADTTAELSAALDDVLFALDGGVGDPNDAIVAIVSTSSGAGYLAARQSGAVDVGGDAVFRGDVGALTLRGPIVDIILTPTSRGYWLIGSDGGVFAFGDAAFVGSLGALKLDKPIVGGDTTTSGAGLWLFAADGGVFAFGDARFQGSAAGRIANDDVVAGGSREGDDGYVLVTSSGGLRLFGDGTGQSVSLSLPADELVVDVARLAG